VDVGRLKNCLGLALGKAAHHLVFFSK